MPSIPISSVGHYYSQSINLRKLYFNTVNYLSYPSRGRGQYAKPVSVASLQSVYSILWRIPSRGGIGRLFRIVSDRATRNVFYGIRIRLCGDCLGAS